MPFRPKEYFLGSFLSGDDNYDDNLLDHKYESDDNGDNSNSHEYSFADKKISPSSDKRKSYRPEKETSKREEEERFKDELLADWSHELATK